MKNLLTLLLAVGLATSTAFAQDVATIEQLSDGNTADVIQNGGDNLVTLTQQGDRGGNIATITQNAEDIVNLTQTAGNYERAKATINQMGGVNKVDGYQLNNVARLEVDQDGGSELYISQGSVPNNTFEVYLSQSDASVATISQAGGKNLVRGIAAKKADVRGTLTVTQNANDTQLYVLQSDTDGVITATQTGNSTMATLEQFGGIGNTITLDQMTDGAVATITQNGGLNQAIVKQQ